MEDALKTQLGLAVLAIVILSVYLPTRGAEKRGQRQVKDSLTKLEKPVPTGLAKRSNGLVKCSTAKPHVPLYMRSDMLRHRAAELAVSVQLGKKAIAAHMEAERLGVCSPDCTVRAVIAGVVRDRKLLKKLEYDQPF